MKVLISGASGFLGSWISRVLAETHEVVALVRESSDISYIPELPTLRIHREQTSSWPKFIVNQSPDVLIMNDWFGVGNAFRNSRSQFDNLHRIKLLALAAKSVNVQTVIGVGSQAELGPITSQISELALDNPTTLYGEAKVSARTILSEVFLGTETRLLWMRIFSTYGPIDQGRWLIPDLVDTLTKSQTMPMTKGEQEWSYLHAYDLASAFSKVIEDTNISGVVNVGNPSTIVIRDAALKIANILGKASLLEFGAIPYRNDQVMKLHPLCEKLTEAGWYPQISFDEGIRQTIEWLGRKNLTPIVTKNGQTIDFKLPVRQ